MKRRGVHNTPAFFCAMTNTHEEYMMRCIELARLGAGSVSPNPMVGAVIVYNEKIIGEGWHQEFGKAHAEVNAINSVKDKSVLNKAEIYINLEPCSHTGKTPPCANLLIQQQFKRVVVGMFDPNPLVSGRGIALLRDAGMEVIYTGLRQSPEMVVQAALQEDVDAIGISIFSGAHMTVFPKVYKLMQEKGLTNVLLTGGGIIPEQDSIVLREMGIGTLFAPGTNTTDIATYIRDWVAKHKNKVQ